MQQALCIDAREAHLHAFAHRGMYAVCPPEAGGWGLRTHLVRQLRGRPPPDTCVHARVRARVRVRA